MRLLLALLVTICASGAGPFDKLTAEDLARGKRLFEAQCAVCHGINGGGGKGPTLAVVRFRNAADDAGLVQVVREGVPSSEMPGAWWMSERESVQVAYYVRSLGRVASVAKVTGNIPLGKEIFFGKGGCNGCHIVDGTGGSLGPDLSTIGARRSAMHLREKITAPEKIIAESFLMVRVALKTGKEVKGIRLNEDTFTIQIKDLSGRFHSYRKADVLVVHKDFGQTPMPAYAGKLSEDELSGLVAYMAGLRGES